MPAISVLVPIYNVEKYLVECLDSLVAQTFSDFEVICVNDGSTDSSKEIIESYVQKDPRFRMIDKPNSGYGASMNKGLDAAEGEYIAILESDDRFEPFALEMLYEVARASDAEVVKADFWLYWSTPPVRKEAFGITDGLETGTLIDPQVDPRIFYRKPSIWSALYERAFLDSNGIRFTETPGASYQDAAFNFKVWVSAKRVVFLPDIVLWYRQDNEQSSVNSPSKVFCVCDEYAEMNRWLDEDDSRAWAQPIMERMKFDSYLWNYDRLTEELGTDFLAHASEEFAADIEAGKVDLSLFEPWAEADLNALVRSVELFKRCRDDVKAPGKLNTFRHYYRLGGWPLIFKVLASKSKRGKRNG